MATLPQDIFTVFRDSAQTCSNQAALTFKDADHSYTSYSYQELSIKIQNFVATLNEYGIGKGDKVALLLSNQPEFPIAFFALMSLGAIAVPIDVQYSPKQAAGIMDHCEAKLLLSTTHLYNNVHERLHIDVCLIDQLNWKDNVQPIDHIDVDPDDTAVIFYTSGTTSAPKGVQLSHHNILTNYQALARFGLMSQRDVFISILPLHHAYAFTTTMLSPLLMGAHIAFVKGLSSKELLECMNAVGVTVFIGVPQLFMLLHRSVCEQLNKLGFFQRSLVELTGLFKRKLKKKFGGSLRIMVCGGAKIDTQIARDFDAWGFSFLEGYGLTETAPVVSFNTIAERKFGSVGRPLEGVEVKIESPDDEGIGEVLVRGGNVMQGYYKDQKKTDQVIIDGWFHTGDLGYCDKDGFLFLTGRKTEMIVLPSGKNIFPDEVEQEYGTTPFVKEIGVLEYADEIVALIKPDESYFKKQGVVQIRDRLKWEIDNISEGLPSYKRLKGFKVITDDLPRTRLGKLKRYELVGIYAQEQDRALEKNTELSKADKKILTSLKERALVIMVEKMKREVKLSDHLELDLGLDSLNRVEFLLELQEGLNLTLDDEMMEKFFRCMTIGELLETLEECVGENFNDNKASSQRVQWHALLDEELAEDTKCKIKLKFGFFSTFFNFVLVILIKLLCRIFFSLEVHGREHLQKDRPFVLCPNHVSYLDALLLVAALPMSVVMQTYFLGLNMFFENALIRPFISVMRLIPIEINYNLVEALKSCVYVYKSDKNICYFPEGQRSIDGEVQDFKKGIGILVSEFQIPVIPVFIKGAFEVWPRTRKWPQPGKVTVTFGSVQDYGRQCSAAEAADERYVDIARRLRNEVLSLRG